MNTTKEQFEAFVEVQKSGVTNMLDLRMVSLHSGVEKSEIKEIIKNYKELSEKYVTK